MWICAECNRENPDHAAMCQAPKCRYINPVARAKLIVGGSVAVAKKKKLNFEYRPVINTSTGKKSLAREGYARKLEKKGTHKLAGGIIY